MFIGPPMAAPYQTELLVRSSDFIMRLTPPALKFECVDAIDDMERTLEEWAELLRALTLMAAGRATLTIAGNDRIRSITFPVDQPITGPYSMNCHFSQPLRMGGCTFSQMPACAPTRDSSSMRFGRQMKHG